MHYSTCLQILLASQVSAATAEARQRIRDCEGRLLGVIGQFLQSEVQPEQVHAFENALANELRELGRELTAWTYNQIEGNDAEALPPFLHAGADHYRRLNDKTANRYVATRFGTITLWRFGYRPRQREDDGATVFPLEQQLGLIAGATPALADKVARAAADAGATQRRVLQQLREEYGVQMGVKRLRQLCDAVAAGMGEHRHAVQVEKVLDWLEEARASRGRYQPVLCVGRDGITLGNQPHGFFEVATSATVTVFDRRRRRLGTVYLAYAPELGQGQMTEQLTRLLREVLRAWDARGRRLPRLCYVTDAGDNEEGYFRKVLRRLRHPRRHRQRLRWHWCVDYYHAAERITTLAEALFGAGREASAWAAKMRKLLLKPSGVRRVLHSAAALRARRGLRASQKASFGRAYNYLRQRSRFMRYAEYRRLGMPIASGITEAACKTIYTQRLKLSGMRWKEAGAQTILDLRVILLSGIWDEVYRRMLHSKTETTLRTYDSYAPTRLRNAA